ncbi:UDP-N-acetylglucosamine 2-epimerase (hydrolyzing) [Planctomycetales bacterium ZRK34]|nr:UDP-N-acetylglucosamine 2-epimerase (hydrolyzing) [Planctomycetales bacterium ZRK34]
MAHNRTIAVVTGTRAEYGLLVPVMRAIEARRELSLQVIVAGAHLVTGTWRDIEFDIAAKVPMQKRGRTGRAADVEALGRGITGFGKAFETIKPNFVVVLGDRIEAFAAASAASVGGMRVGHIHGGDRAEGVADEAMRHAISKLAHVHFAATAQSRRRLIRMGERNVHRTGSPAVDGLRGVKAATDAPAVIVLQHPIGAADAQEATWMRQTLAATKGYTRMVMSPNADPGAAGIGRVLPSDAVNHLPRERWLPTLAGAKAIVGNSSAGLIEAAVLKTPCVNIGPRQAGREKPANVIDCDYGEANVRRALTKALKLDLRRMRHPYGDGRAGERIAELLSKFPLDKITIRKHNAY